MLTGAYDTNSTVRLPHILPPGAPIALTNAAHIFPESTNMGISGADEFGRKVQFLHLTFE